MSEQIIDIKTLAKKCGVNSMKFRNMLTSGKLPLGDMEFGKRRLYSPALAERVGEMVTQITNQEQTSAKQKNAMVTQLEMLKMLDITQAQLKKYIELKLIHPPTHVYNIRKHWTQDEANELVNMLKTKEWKEKLYETTAKGEKDISGLKSIRDIAEMCGVAIITVQHHIVRGHIPRPKTTCPRMPKHSRFWTPDEIPSIIHFFNTRPKLQSESAAKRLKQGYYTRKDVAKKCKVSLIALADFIRKGKVLPPGRKMNTWNYYGRIEYTAACEATLNAKKELMEITD